MSPFDVSKKLHELADSVFMQLESFDPKVNQELKITLQDIKCMAFLGKYYAHKIAGSTYVAMYRESGEKADQNHAIDELTEALQYWQKYAAAASEQNINPLWTNRVGYVDWIKTTEWVAHDIEMAKE